MTDHEQDPASATRRRVLAAAAGAAALAALPPSLALAKPASSTQGKGNHDMSSGYVTTQDGVQIFYKDWGPKTAQPIVFHHGWPLSADDWDAQMMF
ncbi:MAG: alpha/beta hydrolase, partial [Pseudomonadota bacterium]